MKQTENTEPHSGMRRFLKVGATFGAALFGSPVIANSLAGQRLNEVSNNFGNQTISRFRTLGSGKHSHHGRIPNR